MGKDRKVDPLNASDAQTVSNLVDDAHQHLIDIRDLLEDNNSGMTPNLYMLLEYSVGILSKIYKIGSTKRNLSKDRCTLLKEEQSLENLQETANNLSAWLECKILSVRKKRHFAEKKVMRDIE